MARFLYKAPMEEVSYLRAIFALAFVAGLIWLTGWALRHWQGSRFAGNVVGGDKRRMRIIEQLYIDPKRKLLLVACDKRQHLLLLGAQGDTVVESQTINETPPSHAHTPSDKQA